MKYDGKDKETHVFLMITERAPKPDGSGGRTVNPNIYIGGLCVELDVENATKLWDDLGTKLEEIADPESKCWTMTQQDILNNVFR